MELVRFIFWTGIKTLGIMLLGLLAAKAISALRVGGAPSQRGCRLVVRALLYAVVLALVILGARQIGNEVAAENYARASARDLGQRQLVNAYRNASRAVELRPDVLRYWQMLASAKFAQQQYASVVADLPAFLALGGGRLEEDDGYRLAACYYLLGQYAKVPPITQAMIRENRHHAAPYVLEGFTYLSQKRYEDAQRVFFAVLQMFPTQPEAVEGLAHSHFLSGNRAAAQAVLKETARFPFPLEARQRFEALKALYAQ